MGNIHSPSATQDSGQGPGNLAEAAATERDALLRELLWLDLLDPGAVQLSAPEARFPNAAAVSQAVFTGCHSGTPPLARTGGHQSHPTSDPDRTPRRHRR